MEHAPVDADRFAPVAGEEVISLFDIWCILARYKWTILLAGLFGTLVSTIAVLVMPPGYRAEVLLAPVTETEDSSRYAAQLGEFGGIAALAGIDLDRGSQKNEAIATLRSRLLTEQFIKEEKLRPALFPRLWDEGEQQWDVDEPDEIPTLWEAYELFDDEVRRVYEDKKTGLVVLSIEWRDPELAAQWANELVRRVNVRLRSKAAEESEDAIRYLQGQLKRTSVVELQQVLHRLIESEMKESILANINEEYAFRVIDPAVVPEKAFRPVKSLMLLFGTVLGLIAGVSLAMVRNAAHKQDETSSSEKLDRS